MRALGTFTQGVRLWASPPGDCSAGWGEPCLVSCKKGSTRMGVVGVCFLTFLGGLFFPGFGDCFYTRLGALQRPLLAGHHACLTSDSSGPERGVLSND